MKRVLFIVALTSAALLAAPTNPQPSKSRWVVKVSTPEPPGKGKSIALDKLMALPSIPNVGKKQSKPGGTYNETRIPKTLFDELGVHEGSMVKTVGYMHLVAYESKDDDDYHIQLTTTLSDKTHQPSECMVVELPQPDAEHVMSADLRTTFEAERKFFHDKLLAGKDPTSTGSVMQHPVYVEVTGQLFYDGWHADNPGERGKKKCKATPAWELHPIPAIKFAPKPPSP